MSKRQFVEARLRLQISILALIKIQGKICPSVLVEYRNTFFAHDDQTLLTKLSDADILIYNFSTVSFAQHIFTSLSFSLLAVFDI